MAISLLTEGSISSSSTGPTSAYRGLYYKYIESSSGAVGNKAILESSRAFQVTSIYRCVFKIFELFFIILLTFIHIEFFKVMLDIFYLISVHSVE